MELRTGKPLASEALNQLSFSASCRDHGPKSGRTAAPVRPKNLRPDRLRGTGIVGFIEQLGGDVDRIFGRAGIAADMAGCPTLKLRLNSYCQLFGKPPG